MLYYYVTETTGNICIIAYATAIIPMQYAFSSTGSKSNSCGMCYGMC